MIYYNSQTESNKLRLNLYGNIGAGGYLGEGITSGWVAEQIADAGDIDQIDVYINSVGGDVFEGIGIYNELKQFPGQVNVFVTGLAGSIASVIAMAGDQRVMYDGAEIMIHRASAMTMGTAEDHARQSKLLAKFDRKLAGIYADTTQGDDDAFATLMSAETWFDGEAALADGLATHAVPTPAVAPPDATLLNKYQNVPLKVSAWAGQPGGNTNPQPITEQTKMATNQTTPEEEQPKAQDMPAEEVSEEQVQEAAQTVESLKTERDALAQKMADIDAKLAELSGGAEEAPAEEAAPVEAMEEEEEMPTASVLDQFVAKMDKVVSALVADNERLKAMNDGQPELYLAKTNAPDDKTLGIFNNAKNMKNDSAREGYLNSVGVDLNDYQSWAAAH